MDKIYLIKWYHHDYTDITSEIHSAYYSRVQAEEKAKHLNEANKYPLQNDGYGPVTGSEFVVEELAVEGLKCV